MRFFYSAFLLSAVSCVFAGEPLPDFTAQQLAERVSFSTYAQATDARVVSRSMAGQLQSLQDDWMGCVNDFLSTIPVVEEISLPPEPEESKDTLIESSQGMYMDAQESKLCYLGQVRLRDPRLHLDCKRLYLQLEKKKIGEKKNQLTESAQDLTTVDLSAKDTPEKQVLDSPLQMQAQHVLMDLNAKLLYATGEHLSLLHSKGSLQVQGGNPSIFISDSKGIIYVQGDSIKGYAQNAQGDRQEFSCAGSALFLLEGDSLVLERDAVLRAAQTQIRCQGALRMQMQRKMPIKPRSANSLRLSRAYEGLSYVTAVQNVEITGVNSKGEPYSLKGDLLSYDAQQAEFVMTGQKAQLAFADQDLSLQGDALARLYADGSLKLKGESIVGRYQRPATQGDAVLHGQFQSKGELYMRAGENVLHFPQGLSLRDEELDFSATAAVAFHLQGADNVITEDSHKSQQSLAALPKFVFAQLKDLKAIDAQGEVILKGLGERAFDLKGNVVHVDVLQGLARVAANAGQAAQLRYQDSSFEAKSPDACAELQILPSGDIAAKGESIVAQVAAFGREGASMMQASGSIYLHREAGFIELERDVHLQTKDADFTCEGQLVVTLRPSDVTGLELSSTEQRYPHLAYHYAGVKEAVALGGATLRSAQFSLQCDGSLKVEMTENQQAIPQSSDLSILRYAEANRRVRFVAKDNNKQYYRASGDQLKLDGQTGLKLLTGALVTVATKDIVHEASGAGAQVRVDAKNSFSIKGANQRSYAQNLRDNFGAMQESLDPSEQSPATKKKKP